MRKGLTRRTFLGNAAFAGAASALRVTPAIAENPAAGDSIEIDTKNLKVVVDPSTCRWSAQVKETPMGINEVYFLPNGVSRAVAGDPYQLCIYVPDSYSAKRVELSGGLTATMATEANLLKVDYAASTGDDVRWRIFF